MGPAQHKVQPQMTAVADHALLVGFGDTICDETSARVLAFDRALAASPPAGFVESVPALVNLLIDFDPLVTDHEEVRKSVELLLKTSSVSQGIGRLHEVEVCYEGALAPDLAAVAQATGLSIEAVIDHHLQGEYQVRMYGFAPGFAYMSGVPQSIQVPRKPAAVRNIPAGSVLIAGPQCLVTTLTMPTGWSIIGRSSTRILTGYDCAPFLFDVGDQIRFKRIDLEQFEARAREGSHA
jgi:inhibitor of KinA